MLQPPYIEIFWQRKISTNLTIHWWFTIHVLTMSRDIYKENKQAVIYQSSSRQKFVLYGILY